MGVEFSYPEGATPIDPDEAAGLIPALSTQAQLNAFEAVNIGEAVVWAERSRIVKSSLLEPATLRRIHQRMFGQTWRWAGQYRITQKSIACEAWKISSELKALCDDVRVWIESESYAPDEILARFHHRLVFIHPFPNGNGRFARLATDLLARQLRLEALSWGLRTQKEPGSARTEYLQALRAADAHDLGLLIGFLRS